MSQVSIIIPTYNRLSFLKEAIVSVFKQTFQDFELIVVDDGSTDGTSDYLLKYYPQLCLINQQNTGVSAARNAGIKESSGKLIAFLDSDDLWLPQKLERQVEFFKNHPDISVCQTEEVWLRNGKKVNPKQKHKKHSGWIFERCIPLCIVSPSAVMLKKEVFDNVGVFDEGLPACEDYDLWLRISPKYQIATLEEPLIVKRGGHEDQLSKQWGLDRYRIKALQKALNNENLNEQQKGLVGKSIEERKVILKKGSLKRGYQLDI